MIRKLTNTTFALALALTIGSTPIFAQTTEVENTEAPIVAQASPEPSPVPGMEANAIAAPTTNWTTGSIFEGTWHSTKDGSGSFSRLIVLTAGGNAASVLYQIGPDGPAAARKYDATLTEDGIVTWTQVVQGVTYRISFALMDSGHVDGKLESEGRLLSEVDMQRK